jgi:hypothetical protein
LALFRQTIIDPRIVPNVPVEIDWSHPLARGLVSAIIPTCANYDLVQQNGIIGPTANINGTAPYGLSPLPASLQIQTGTLTYFGRFLAEPSNDLSVLSTIIDENPYNPYGLCFSTNNAGYVSTFEYGDGQGYHTIPNTGVAWNGFSTSFSAAFNSGSSVSIYADGKFVVSEAITTTWGFSPSPVLVFGGDGRPGSVNNKAGFIHNRVLDASEETWLNAEPFGMLRPIVSRRFYNIPSFVPPVNKPFYNKGSLRNFIILGG